MTQMNWNACESSSLSRQLSASQCILAAAWPSIWSNKVPSWAVTKFIHLSFWLWFILLQSHTCSLQMSILLLSLILEEQTPNGYTNGLFCKLLKHPVEQIDTINSLARTTISSLSVLLSNQSDPCLSSPAHVTWRSRGLPVVSGRCLVRRTGAQFVWF